MAIIRHAPEPMSARCTLPAKCGPTETGLDEFPARYYSSVQGRWYSPDWASAQVPAPYSDLQNPQSLNLYDYVGSDPTNHNADANAGTPMVRTNPGAEVSGMGIRSPNWPPNSPINRLIAPVAHKGLFRSRRKWMIRLVGKFESVLVRPVYLSKFGAESNPASV
jgi:RHS repeat-associated protein